MPDRLFGRLQRLLALPEIAERVGEGVQRTGQVGNERVGPCLGQRAAEADRLFAAFSASSRCPRSLSVLARLFSERARSGMNASGRASASAR
jgi:hypothetical protein